MIYVSLRKDMMFKMTHMNLDTRNIIEESLDERKNFTEISELTGYHRTTIANEILKRRLPAKERTYGRTFTNCAFEENCEKYEGEHCTCKCSMFMLKQCAITTNPPYVCNGCSKKATCRMQRFFYRAKDADEDYLTTLKNARIGLNIPPNIINQINTVIAPLIKDKHQTVNQVFLNHPEICCFSKSEFYRLVEGGYVDIKCIDLPRQVKYRKRRNKKPDIKIKQDPKIKINRTYKDYETYISTHNTFVVEGDTVEGEKGGKVFLTLNVIQFEFMFVYILDRQSTDLVTEKIKWMKGIIGKELWSKLFECILLDNGKEFFDPNTMEIFDEEKVSNVFFCDKSKPYQKGCCEENHHYIRYYLPKGECTFDNLTQEDCNKIMSNIASIPREKLKGLTPYEALNKHIPSNILNALGAFKINKDDVNLSPSILNGKGKRDKKKKD